MKLSLQEQVSPNTAKLQRNATSDTGIATSMTSVRQEYAAA